MTKVGELLIGTSGFNYKHWRETFYPQGVRQKDWLRFFAEHFPTVELNVTFYRFPRAETMAGWSNQVPRDFRFSVKLWRGITHYRKLKNCQGFNRNFADAIGVLPSRQRGALLIQLPNMSRAVERLTEYLGDLKEATAGKWKIAVEFRNPEWLTEDVYKMLDRERVAICLHDMRGSATTVPNKTKLVYIRRHGSGEGKYQGGYSSEQIRNDSNQIRGWLDQGRSVYVYYNNDIQGHAIADARALQSTLRPA